MNSWKRRKKHQLDENESSQRSKFRITKLIRKELYLTMFSIIGVTLVILGSSYAIFSSVNKSVDYNVVSTGTLKIAYDDTSSGLGDTINLNGSYPMSDSSGQSTTPYKFKITNTGTLPVEYTIRIANDTDMISADKCSSNLISNSYLRYSVNGGTPNYLSSADSNNGIIVTDILGAGSSKTYQIRLWISSNNAPNSVLGAHYHGKISVDGVVSESGERNSNIKGVYAYNSSSCITGEETTCQSIAPSTYEKGTIVKYAVSDDEERYFYVLHDDGDTLTMQQREGTMYYGFNWDYSSSSSSGPRHVLEAIEEATKDWDNVLDQTYTMGTTTFLTSSYTGCSSYNSCTSNTYTMSQRTGKARLITVQEAAAQGCTSSYKTCPIWMYNYLSGSTSYGGTNNYTNYPSSYYTGRTGYYGTISNGYYWTMNAYTGASGSAYAIRYDGSLATATVNSSSSYYGIRAVIKVNKS